MTERHARLLLLLPALGDLGITDEAVAAVVSALKRYGAPQDCQVLARRLLSGHPMWGAAPWQFDPDEHLWLCDGHYSRRGIAPRLPAEQRSALERCLTPSL